MSDIEQQWASLNGDQAALSGPQIDDRLILQREQDHFGFIVLGTPEEHAEIGQVIDGIHIGLDRAEAPDIKLRVIGITDRAEWRAHVLFNFGPSVMAEFDAFAGIHRHIVRAIAE